MEAIDICGAVSGLLNIVVAMKFARNKERKDKTSPIATWNVIPVEIISWIFSSLARALFFAMYFVIAGVIPQSWNMLIVTDGINAIVYTPYSVGAISLAKIIVPIASTIVDIAFPMKS